MLYMIDNSVWIKNGSNPAKPYSKHFINRYIFKILIKRRGSNEWFNNRMRDVACLTFFKHLTQNMLMILEIHVLRNVAQIFHNLICPFVT